MSLKKGPRGPFGTPITPEEAIRPSPEGCSRSISGQNSPRKTPRSPPTGSHWRARYRNHPGQAVDDRKSAKIAPPNNAKERPFVIPNSPVVKPTWPRASPTTHQAATRRRRTYEATHEAHELFERLSVTQQNTSNPHHNPVKYRK